jgi:hypothetical protein
VLVELVLAEDEVDEDVGDDADDELEEPGPEGHVDVHHISLFPVSDDFRLKEAGGGRHVRVLEDVAERQRIKDDFGQAVTDKVEIRNGFSRANLANTSFIAEFSIAFAKKTVYITYKPPNFT